MKKTYIIIGLAILLSGCSLPTANQTPNTEQNTNSQENTGATLNLSGQGLSQVPVYVFSLTKLEALDISDNQLGGAIQAEIRQLQNLRSLDASNNQMTGLPAEIGQLQKLETLNLSDNQLTGLPHELGNLKNLKTLDISGNDYSQYDLEIIEKSLPSTVNIITL